MKTGSQQDDRCLLLQIDDIDHPQNNDEGIEHLKTDGQKDSPVS